MICPVDKGIRVLGRRQFLWTCALGLAPRWGRAVGAWDSVCEYHWSQAGEELIVVRSGRVVFQDGPGLPHDLASGAKSFWGVLALILRALGRANLDDPLSDIFSEWRNDPRGVITIRQLLSLTSGLEGGQNLHPPTYEQALKAKLSGTPGSLFQYGPIPFEVFGEFVKRKMGSDPVTLLQTYVLGPAGAQLDSWEWDAHRDPILASGAHMTAENWARFGTWVLRQGRNFQELFQGTLVNPAYGLTWWLSQGVSSAAEARLSAHMRSIVQLSKESGLPRQIYLACGWGDQRLYLIPGLDLVVARLAKRGSYQNEQNTTWSDSQFLLRVVRAMRPS